MRRFESWMPRVDVLPRPGSATIDPPLGCLPPDFDETLTFLSAAVRLGLKPLWPGILGVATITAACSDQIPRQASAIILALEGSAAIDGAPGSNPLPRAATPRSLLRKGEIIRTGGDGAVSLMLLPGALGQLGPNSVLHVTEISISKNGNATDHAMTRSIALQLLQGTLDMVVQFESKAEIGSVRVETPRGLLSFARPGTCRLAVEPARARLQCVRGAINFRSTGERPGAVIEAGFFTEWPARSAELLPIELEGGAQEIAEQSLKVERKLLDLQRRERDLPFPWRQL